MLNKITKLEELEYLLVNGNLKKEMPLILYEKVLALCNKQNVKVIINSHFLHLKTLLQYHPYLIRLKEEQLVQEFGIIVRDEEDIRDVLEFLCEKGAQNILLQWDRKGVYFYNGKEIYFVHTTLVNVASPNNIENQAFEVFLDRWLENPNETQNALKYYVAIWVNSVEDDKMKNLEDINIYRKNIDY